MLRDRCIPTPALVTPDVDEIMLGVEWLTKHRCLWDFANGRIFLNGTTPIPLTTRRSANCRRVYVREPVVIPPRRQVDVVSRTPLLPGRFAGPLIVDSHELGPGVYVARTLMEEGTRDLRVRVINTTSKPHQLDEGRCLGASEPVEIVETTSDPAPRFDSTSPTPKANPDVIAPLLEQLPDDLTDNQRSRVEDLLRSYDDIFSKGEYDMGRTNLVEHVIDTGNHRPIRQGLRRHPLAHLDEIDRQVDGLIQHDYVEPAASPWSSNVLLVKKKNGTFRLCIDYRALNTVTYKDAYPLPHIDTCLGSMNGACWFSTIDLRSGYHNIPIREEDRDKTSFVTRRGSFRYKVLPFGLSTAPSVFQRLMDLVLCGLTYMTCLVYLDDIILYAPDFDTHLGRLQQVFDRLRAANLKLHPGKSCFLQQRVDFLGHVLSAKGVEVQQEKISSIQDWPTPRNIKELRSFLGLCSYYRRFVPRFATIAAPLYRLQNKQVQFEWGQSQQDAFETLKNRLMSTPILGMPIDTGRFYLDTDASDTGLGAVLSQDQEGTEVVIAYASRTLHKPETNYDVTRRELLAVIYSLKTFRQYLLGRRFVLRTDHQALQWLRRTPEPMGQMARWMTLIEEYDFEIVHRPGARHGNADALSRRPEVRGVIANPSDNQQNEADVTSHMMTDWQTVSSAPDAVSYEEDASPSAGENPQGDDIARAQETDPEMGRLVRMVREGVKPSLETFAAESETAKELLNQWGQLRFQNGLVYREWMPKKGPPVKQLLVPASCRENFLRQVHAGLTGGHLGVRKTLDQVQRRAYWPHWRADTRRWVQRCEKCQTYHRGKPPRQANLQPLQAGSPMEKIHFDLTGPHPRTRRGSTYILTCICPFTKWAEAFPLPNKEAATVARVLVEQVICRYGTPIGAISDRGKEVDGNLMREISRLLGVDKLRTTAYKPSTNAQIERFHGTLNAIMAKTINDNQTDWDVQLPYVMAAYRASRHASTGMTPNFLMLGREVRAPVDLMYGEPSDTEPVSYVSYADEMDHRMRNAYAMVRNNLNEAAIRNKRHYDIRVHPATFKTGDWVWYFNPRRVRGKQEKWRRKYTGPFLVIKVIGTTNVVLQKTKKAKPFCTHVDKVKLYEADEYTASWIEDASDAERSSPGDASSSAGEQPVERIQTEHPSHYGDPSTTRTPDRSPGDGLQTKSHQDDSSMVTVPLSVYGAPLITPVDRPRRERRLPLRYRE